MKKLAPIILFLIFNNISFSQNSIQFKYINNFYDEISFEEYESNKTIFSEFGNLINENLSNIKEIDSVNIKSKIDFFSKNKKYLAIKFNKISSTDKIKILCLENNSLVELPYPYSSILKLKGKYLIEFYSSQNSPKYSEINKLKSLAKDSDGILNIYKLADVIEKNKASLSKYLDE